MDPDRRRQIEDVYDAALAQSLDELAAFLTKACAGDDALRREVESLLAQTASGAALLEGHPIAAAAAVMTPPASEVLTELPVQEPALVDLSGSTIGRFVIRERLGAGGMGEVYRADDTQLKRTVAIKRLVPNLHNLNPTTTRLLKEAQRASALNHTRIASVYDVFTMGSELFLVMEYIDGITLRQRMTQSISVSDFCAIAVQCTEALSAAHGKGILHGDLKPANIMLTRDGDVKVCDFGLARRLPNGDSSADTTTTARHGIAGTPAYLAPEVVLEHSIDERADIFSLGVVFYEMLARRNPFMTDGLVATLDRILNYSPEPLDRLNTDVSGRLARVVHRMLEKDPCNRSSSAVAIGETLSLIKDQQSAVETRRRLFVRVRTLTALAGTATLVALTVPRVTDWRSEPSIKSVPHDINVVVLPFTVEGTGGNRQYFTEGLTEALNEQLSKLTVNRRLQVATVADRHGRHVTNALEAREQLGANVALSGSLHYSENVVRIDTLLIDTRSGQQLRAETFTADASNPLAVQARVVETAVRMMGIDLDPAERTVLTTRATTQPGAYDFYLQARGYLLNYDRIENLDSAIAVFRRALEVDSRYALAYAGLGQAYWRKHELTNSRSWVEPARGACEGALGIDASVAEPHACLGMVLNGTGEYERAATAFNRALDLEPTNDLAYLGLATAYEKLGKHSDAEQTYRRAIDLRPHYWAAYNYLAAYYYRSGRYDDASTMFQQVVALAPDSFRGYNGLGAVHFMRDRTDEAIAAFQKSLAIRQNYVAASNLGTLYYFEGEYRRAADLFRQALSLDQGNFEVWGNLAQSLEAAGEDAAGAVAFSRARELAQERLGVNPKNAALHIAMAEYNAALGQMDSAKASLSEALKLTPEDTHTLFQIAVFFESRLKLRDEALKWLAKAVERGQTWREIDRAPELRQLRADPRFQQLRRSR